MTPTNRETTPPTPGLCKPCAQGFQECDCDFNDDRLATPSPAAQDDPAKGLEESNRFDAETRELFRKARENVLIMRAALRREVVKLPTCPRCGATGPHGANSTDCLCQVNPVHNTSPYKRQLEPAWVWLQSHVGTEEDPAETEYNCDDMTAAFNAGLALVKRAGE